MTRKKVFVGCSYVLGAIAIAIIGISFYRVEKYEAIAENTAKESGIETVYDVSSDIDTKKKFFKELGSLISWEEKNSLAIDTTFEYDASKHGPSEKYEDTFFLLGMDSTKKIKEHMRIQQNIKLHNKLKDGTYSAIDAIFKGNESMFDTSQTDVYTCYRYGKFKEINLMMNQLENGQGMDAYNTLGQCIATYKGSDIALDIGFYTYPQLLIDACEKGLNNVLNSDDFYIVKTPVYIAKLISDKFGIVFENLDQASLTLEYLEYLRKPDIPSVEMSVGLAKQTKLGEPSEITTYNGSWSHKRHTYGDMYWYVDDKMIFRAHYVDGFIENVTDNRNPGYPQPSYTPYTNSSNTEIAPDDYDIDPDDYDIEGYYEDYQDLYDSYEDAYDGFLDDESVWDDYR